MNESPSILRRGVVRCDELSRGALALMVGAAIPLICFLVAAALMDARSGRGGDHLASLFIFPLLPAALGGVVTLGVQSLQRLDRGWTPFLRFASVCLVAVVALHVVVGAVAQV